MHHIISLSMAIIFFLDMSKIFISGAISHFSPQHTICLNIFQPTFSASMVVYFYQYIYYKDAKNQILHSHHTSLLEAQSEPEPLLLELLLLLPDLLLAAGLPDFDLVPDLDLLLLDADPLRDLLLLLETDRDLDFERDFLPAATGLRVGDRDLLRLTLLLADLLLDLLRLTLRDLLRLTERDLLLLALRDLLLLTDLDLLRLFDLDLLRDLDLEADRDLDLDRDFDLDPDLDLSPVLVVCPSSSSSSSSSSDISSSSWRGSRFFSLYLCILCSCLFNGRCLTTSLLLLICWPAFNLLLLNLTLVSSSL